MFQCEKFFFIFHFIQNYQKLSSRNKRLVLRGTEGKALIYANKFQIHIAFNIFN